MSRLQDGAPGSSPRALGTAGARAVSRPVPTLSGAAGRSRATIPSSKILAAQWPPIGRTKAREALFTERSGRGGPVRLKIAESDDGIDAGGPTGGVPAGGQADQDGHPE